MGVPLTERELEARLEVARANNKVGNPCPYCTRTMEETGKLRPTRDHVVAKSKAKIIYEQTGYRFSRQIIACDECNKLKADKSLAGFISRLEELNRKLMEEVELNNERIANVSYLSRIGLEE